MCGGDVRHIDPKSITENKCPYCGFELYNHSEEIYDEKIENIKEAKSKLVSKQMVIGIAALVVVLIGGIFVLNRIAYRQTDQYHLDASDKMTKKLERAYEKEDWDTLYNLTIENAEEGLSSPYYFAFRTAWMLSSFVPMFDEGYENNDSDMMKDAYRWISTDYNDRDGLSEMFKLIPEIEAELADEYQRETKIMEEKGLLE